MSNDYVICLQLQVELLMREREGHSAILQMKQTEIAMLMEALFNARNRIYELESSVDQLGDMSHLMEIIQVTAGG